MSFLEDDEDKWRIYMKCFGAMHCEGIEILLTIGKFTERAFVNFTKYLTAGQDAELMVLVREANEIYKKIDSQSWDLSETFALLELYDQEKDVYKKAEDLGKKWQEHFFTNREYLCMQIKECKNSEENKARKALCFFEKKLLQLAVEEPAPTKRKARIM